jgi:hypothetical protein
MRLGDVVFNNCVLADGRRDLSKMAILIEREQL